MVSCEHASHRLPAPYACWLQRALGKRAWRALARARHTHRGWDPGAREVAVQLGALLGAPVHLVGASRLLVDVNRSAHHRARFSEWSRLLPASERVAVAQRVWEPHWRRVADAIAAAHRQGVAALHVAAHSFDPTLAAGRERIDVGLLYDPKRPHERQVADAIARRLAIRAPALRVRRNAPYRGVADGLPTAMRKRFAEAAYCGLEIECNQALVRGPRWPQVRRALALAVAEALMVIAHQRCAGLQFDGA